MQQQQQWCTGCFALVSSSILYEKHSLICPYRQNIKYTEASSNPNDVNKLPTLNRYPNNEELFKMVVSLTDNLNKANKTITALKRKINLRSNNIDILEFLNDNIIPSTYIDQILTTTTSLHIKDTLGEEEEEEEEEEGKGNEEKEEGISIETFYEIGFYSFVIRCLDTSLMSKREGRSKCSTSHFHEDVDEDNIFAEDEEYMEDSESYDYEKSANKEGNNTTLEGESDIVETIKSSTINKEDDKNGGTSYYVAPILCFKQKKDKVFIFENNNWSENNIAEMTVNNVFNRFSRMVNSVIMRLFGDYKERHEHELYNVEFQSELSKRLKSICSIDLNNDNIIAKVIKPWYSSHKLDLYDFMNNVK